MYKALLFILLSSAPFIQAQTPQQDTQTLQKNKMINLMVIIRNDYERFIDTPPSSKKEKLAKKVNKDIKQFESQYGDSAELPAVLELQEQVTSYLDNLE